MLCFLFALLSVAVSFEHNAEYLENYRIALDALDWESVAKDIKSLLTDSKSFWPADYGNYGPFMVRQAWHCSGSYRTTDGRGGCEGGRQRYEPERSWDDNTNLDKAKELLWPIKEKYGLGLSWGDLMILTGNVAIESMGGPVFGFCGGRVDDYDGSESELLGPSVEQVATEPCPVNGQCKKPFGSTTIGLIYLNPEGPLAQPIPEKSALEVRDVFGRMDMGDIETVALIGGGHAFGKTHGACPKGPGLPPKDDPKNPWAGNCGTGKGNDTFTSGFEGPWTPYPTSWSNTFFKDLINKQWSLTKGPGGHYQWKSNNVSSPIMRLTTDMSLTKDPANIYQSIVDLFANNITALDYHFSRAWYKLTSRDQGPITRCVGPWVPPVQEFQNPLPPTPSRLPNWSQVARDVTSALTRAKAILPPDYYNGRYYYNAIFVHLAYQSATTYRYTDHLGGANGARIRFSPQKDWPANVGMDKALEILQPIKESYENLSWADLIVLAGTVSLDDIISFCGGRTDASNGNGATLLAPNGNSSLSIEDMRKEAVLNQLSDVEVVALAARPRSSILLGKQGYHPATWSPDPTKLSNEYFTILLDNEWDLFKNPSGKTQYKSRGKSYYMLPVDLNVRWDDDYLAIAQVFATDNLLFLSEFSKAWYKIMNNDRFDGPTSNVCTGRNDFN